MTCASTEVVAEGGVPAILELAQAMVRRLDGTITYWTRGAQQLYGWDAQEAVGRVSHVLLETEFPEPLEVIEKHLLATGEWHGRLRHRARSGACIHVVSHWALHRDASGKPSVIAEVNTDLGLEDAAEAARSRLAAIIASSNDAIIGKTLSGIVTDWNAAAQSLFGYSAAEMIGTPITRLFPSEMVGQEAEILRKIASGDMIPTFETIRRHQSGLDIPVAVTISPIRSALGRIVGASKVVRDLRDQREKEQKLSELSAELRHATRLSEMGQLAAAMIHEVNQPLTAITNYAGAIQSIANSLDQERLATAASKLREQVVRATQITRSFREFMRRSAPSVVSVDLNELIEEAIRLACIDPNSRGVSLEVLPPSRTVLVEVDRIQIQQVLFNLMRNAFEAMAGLIMRRLTVRMHADGDGMAVVSVEDTGTGISASLGGDPFAPFASTKPDGMGLGLAVCRSIIENHGGELVLVRSGSDGTMFQFTVPLATASDGGAEMHDLAEHDGGACSDAEGRTS